MPGDEIGTQSIHRFTLIPEVSTFTAFESLCSIESVVEDLAVEIGAVAFAVLVSRCVHEEDQAAVEDATAGGKAGAKGVAALGGATLDFGEGF